MSDIEIPKGYTPGPWVIGPKLHGFDFSVVNPKGDAEFGNWLVAGARWEANARLIALAPEMADEIVRLRARERDLTLEGLSLIGRLEALRTTLAETDVGSLPNDYPVQQMAQDRMNEIVRLRAEVEKYKAIIAAADRGTPIYKAVQRILDEQSAWIARPNDDCTYAIALAAGIAWTIHYPVEVVDQNLELLLEANHLRAEVAKKDAALRPLACTCEAKHQAECSRSEVDCPFWNARAALTTQEKQDD